MPRSAKGPVPARRDLEPTAPKAPEARQSMGLPATREDLELIRQDCLAMVKKRAMLSAGATVLPLPGADVGADIALLMDLLPAINRKFGLSAEQIETLDPHIKKVILVTVTSVGSQLIGRVVTATVIRQVLLRFGLRVATKSVVRVVPILGQLVSAGISFGAMRTLGNAHVEDCYEVARQTLTIARM